jgi:hypothetical protein
MLWEVFVRRFEEAFEQYERGRLTGEEAGELLGMSGRNFRRCAFATRRTGSRGCAIGGSVKYRRAVRRRVSLRGCRRFIGSATATSR